MLRRRKEKIERLLSTSSGFVPWGKSFVVWGGDFWCFWLSLKSFRRKKKKGENGRRKKRGEEEAKEMKK